MFDLVILIGIVLAIPVGVAVGLAYVITARRQVRGLATAVRELQNDVAALKRRAGETGMAPADAPVAPLVAPSWQKVIPGWHDRAATPATPEPAPTRAAREVAPPHPPSPQPEAMPTIVGGSRELEQSLIGRWAVWLGAVALALGGAFLVKYSIDNELLGPETRVALGLALGLALNLGGEYLHRRPPSREPIAAGSYATALIASGMATLYSSIYAAHAIYGFIGAATAFVLLGMLSASAVALSLRHGQLISAVGILGGFIVPLLVSSTEPAPWTLFLYLAAVVGSCAALVRWTSWRWMGWLTLAGTYFWALFWFLFLQPTPSDHAPLTSFLVFCTVAFFLLRPAGAAGETGKKVTWTAAFITPFLMLLQLMESHFDAEAITGAVLLVAIYLFQGARDHEFDRVSWIAGVFAAVDVLAWNVPLETPRPGIGNPIYPPPAFPPLATLAALLAAFVSLSCFWMVWRAKRPERWAAASAATPLLILAALYVRRADALGEMPWAIIGLAVAALEIAAASRVARSRAEEGKEAALAFYAAASVAAISLAATMSLERAWLTVALAVELPALAWVAARTRVFALRPVALVLAAIVGARLLLEADLVNSLSGSRLLFNWILYGYGVPVLAFAVSAVWFRRERDDWLVMVLEALSIMASFLLVILEIRHAFAIGPGLFGRFSAGEVAAQTNAWLIGTLILFRMRAILGRPVFVMGSRLAAAVGLVILVLGPGIGANPLVDPSIRVGATPLFNLLLPLYLLPTLLALAILRATWRAGEQVLAYWFGAAALAFGFGFVSLSVRQFYRGSALLPGLLTDAESYTYSASWLLFGGALLLAGILRASPIIRQVGLGVLALAVAKTFLYDMSSLAGLYRAASFLGLGAALLALGYLYQRFVRETG